MILTSLVLSVAVQASPAPSSPSAPPTTSIDLCEVRVRDAAELGRLFAAASDPDDHHRIAWETPGRNGTARVYADEPEQMRLRRQGFDVEVLQRDLASFYAARAAADTTPLTVGGSMGGYKTLAEIVAEIDRLSSTYPSIVSPKFSIGTTVEGRPIWAFRVSDNPGVDEPGEPTAWFDAIHHAREPMGGEALLLFADSLCTSYPAVPSVKRMVEARNIIFVPCVNPDGYEYNRTTNPGGGGLWRKNRRNNGGSFGIDLNRNYGWQWGSQWPGSSGTPGDETYRGPSPFSEPETRAIRDAQLARPPAISLSAHTYGNLWLFPWGYDTVLTQDDATYRAWSALMIGSYPFEIGSPPEILYVANGVSLDWSYGQLASMGFSPEIGADSDGFWPAPSRILPLFASVKTGFEDVVKWSGAWPERAGVDWREVQGDGDAAVERGETWDLTVLFVNRGLAAASGSLSLASSDPDVTVLNSLASFSVGPTVFAATQVLPGTKILAHYHPLSLRIALAPNAASGTHDLDLGVTFEGLTTLDVVPVDVGQVRVLAKDDMEIADFGWQSGNATNWSWQRAVPQQTTSGSDTVQPGNDNPAGTGTMCWVTGAAAGGMAGTNDVDGTTVLTSPVFRASGFAQLELEYARWFADLPGGTTDDVLLVEVSNNGGSSWTTLESTGNANAWQTKNFALQSFLPLTDAMRVRFTASDSPNNDLCEALVDDVVLRTVTDLPTLGAWGATNAGASARLFVDGPVSVSYKVRTSTSTGAGQSVPGTDGLLYLTGTITDLATGTTGADGRVARPWTVPPMPSGTTVYLQVLLDEGGPQAAYSNLLTVVVQ